jgi:hypothetical protein
MCLYIILSERNGWEQAEQRRASDFAVPLSLRPAQGQVTSLPVDNCQATFTQVALGSQALGGRQRAVILMNEGHLGQRHTVQ